MKTNKVHMHARTHTHMHTHSLSLSSLSLSLSLSPLSLSLSLTSLSLSPLSPLSLLSLSLSLSHTHTHTHTHTCSNIIKHNCGKHRFWCCRMACRNWLKFGVPSKSSENQSADCQFGFCLSRASSPWSTDNGSAAWSWRQITVQQFCRPRGQVHSDNSTITDAEHHCARGQSDPDCHFCWTDAGGLLQCFHRGHNQPGPAIDHHQKRHCRLQVQSESK